MTADIARREYAQAVATGHRVGSETNIARELMGATNNPASSNAASM
jgi:hypothetical protein